MSDRRSSAEYRRLAAEEQAFAIATRLPNVKLMHERAAEGWLRLAERRDKLP